MALPSTADASTPGVRDRNTGGVRRVIAGGSALAMLNYIAREGAQNARVHAQPREIEVLRHSDTGLTSGEIVAVLHLSTSTVDTYRERIKAKLDLASAAELTHYATRWVLRQD